MPRPKTLGLTPNELELMRVLWEKSPLSVTEIHERITRRPKPAYNSVLTGLRILEEKGHIRHKKEGKAYLYEPVLDDKRYRTTELKRIIRGLFQGSAHELAVHLVKHEPLSRAERDELKRLLEEL